MSDSVQLSDAEWQIMNLIWERQPIMAQDVIAAVCEPSGWTPSTVRTMLHRLAKKGSLLYTPEGNRYWYRAGVRRVDCVRQAARSFLDRVFDGNAAPLLNHFVRSTKFTPEELVELRQLLDRKEQ